MAGQEKCAASGAPKNIGDDAIGLASVQLPATHRPSRTLLVVAISSVVSVVLTSVVWWSVLQTRERYWESVKSPLAGNNFLEPVDGVDPMQTACRNDRVIAAAEPRMDGAVQVEMLYSNSCMGVWGRATRVDGKSDGNSLSMRIYPADDIQSSRSQERSSDNVNSLYTPFLIEPEVEARVCGIATITVDDEVTELGPAICI